jgi:hypothetical protein
MLFSEKSVSISTGRRTVTRAGQGIQHRSPQYDYEMLCADIAQKQFIPLLTRLREHDVAEFPALLSHQGEEFLYVLTGVKIHTDQYLPLHRLSPTSASPQPRLYSRDRFCSAEKFRMG